MLIVLVLAAFIGAFATAFWLSDYGIVMAVLFSPFGASLAAFVAAMLIAIRSLANPPSLDQDLEEAKKAERGRKMESLRG